MQRSKWFVMLGLALAAGCDLTPDFDDLCLAPTDFSTDYEGQWGEAGQAKVLDLCGEAPCDGAHLSTGSYSGTLVVQADPRDYVTLESSAPEVLSVMVSGTAAPCVSKDDAPIAERLFELEALSAGEVELTVLVAGKEVDRFSFVVAEPTALSITVNGTPQPPDEGLELPRGFWVELGYVLLDAAGHELMSQAPIDWQVDDVAVAELEIVDGSRRVSGDTFSFPAVTLETLAEGDTIVHARHGELEASVAVRVNEP